MYWVSNFLIEKKKEKEKMWTAACCTTADGSTRGVGMFGTPTPGAGCRSCIAASRTLGGGTSSHFMERETDGAWPVTPREEPGLQPGGWPGVRYEKMQDCGYQKLLGFTLEQESSPHMTSNERLRGPRPRVRNKREGGGRPGMWQRARSKGKLIFPPFFPK